MNRLYGDDIMTDLGIDMSVDEFFDRLNRMTECGTITEVFAECDCDFEAGMEVMPW